MNSYWAIAIDEQSGSYEPVESHGEQERFYCESQAINEARFLRGCGLKAVVMRYDEPVLCWDGDVDE